ncbi:hypothetical protein X801_08711, partial [Opisthorchis viverrini]
MVFHYKLTEKATSLLCAPKSPSSPFDGLLEQLNHAVDKIHEIEQVKSAKSMILRLNLDDGPGIHNLSAMGSATYMLIIRTTDFQRITHSIKPTVVIVNNVASCNQLIVTVDVKRVRIQGSSSCIYKTMRASLR